METIYNCILRCGYKHTLLCYRTLHKQFIHCPRSSLPLRHQYQHTHKIPLTVHPQPSKSISYHQHLTSALILTSHNVPRFPTITFLQTFKQKFHIHMFSAGLLQSHLSCPWSLQLWQMSQHIQVFYVIKLLHSGTQQKRASTTLPTSSFCCIFHTDTEDTRLYIFPLLEFLCLFRECRLKR